MMEAEIDYKKYSGFLGSLYKLLSLIEASCTGPAFIVLAF